MKAALSWSRRRCRPMVSIFLIVLMTATVIAGMTGCHLPYQDLEIRTWYDLDEVRNNLNGHHILMNDLDSTTPGYEELASPTAHGGQGWLPIMIWVFEQGNRGLTGTFDGQGYEIRDLFINCPGEGDAGLFGVVNEGGVIKNIGVVNADVIGYVDVGTLVGYNGGIVSNSHGTGNVSGGHDPTIEGRVGGLVGTNDGTVSNSYSTASVTGGYDTNTRGCFGGLVGYNGGTVSNSYANGNVTGCDSVGGLVGLNGGGTVSNSYATGSVTGNSSVGGLVGGNSYYGIAYGTVSNSYATGSVTGSDLAGGLVGHNGGNVTNSLWDVGTSGQNASAGGTGKNTTEMQDIATFSGATWNVTAVANPGARNPSYIWNILDDLTYPFLSWQPA